LLYSDRIIGKSSPRIDATNKVTGQARFPGDLNMPGEPPFLPLAPAILAAIHDATGVWIDQIPVTPERMLQTIQLTAP
jgi:CO/xanthine dehydrogenase Mo-binding subunit